MSVTKLELRDFKRSVVKYLKWANAGEEPIDDSVLKDIAKAKSFEAVQCILIENEDSEAPFLEMVQRGYF